MFKKISHLTDNDIVDYIYFNLCEVKCIHLSTLSGMWETWSICAMALVSIFLPYGIRVSSLSLWFFSRAFVVSHCWSLDNTGGFISLLAIIWQMSSLILDSTFSILLFCFLRLHMFVNLNFNLNPSDNTLFGSGFLKGLWSICFESFPSVFVGNFGSGIVGGSSLGCLTREVVKFVGGGLSSLWV